MNKARLYGLDISFLGDGDYRTSKIDLYEETDSGRYSGDLQSSADLASEMQDIVDVDINVSRGDIISNLDGIFALYQFGEGDVLDMLYLQFTKEQFEQTGVKKVILESALGNECDIQCLHREHVDDGGYPGQDIVLNNVKQPMKLIGAIIAELRHAKALENSPHPDAIGITHASNVPGLAGAISKHEQVITVGK